MEKMVMSWKYWACLALTGAAVVLVFGEPSEWLNGYRNLPCKRRRARRLPWRRGKWAKDCSRISPKNKTAGKPRKSRNGLRPRPDVPDIPGAMRSRGRNKNAIVERIR